MKNLITILLSLLFVSSAFANYMAESELFQCDIQREAYSYKKECEQVKQETCLKLRKGFRCETDVLQNGVVVEDAFKKASYDFDQAAKADIRAARKTKRAAAKILISKLEGGENLTATELRKVLLAMLKELR